MKTKKLNLTELQKIEGGLDDNTIPCIIDGIVDAIMWLSIKEGIDTYEACKLLNGHL